MAKPICVIGTRTDQQRIIASRFPGLRIKFIGSDSIERGCSSGMTGDVIIWTRFSSHKHTSRAKRLAQAVHLVSGGMTSLIAAIDKLATRAG